MFLYEKTKPKFKCPLIITISSNTFCKNSILHNRNKSLRNTYQIMFGKYSNHIHKSVT